MPKYYRKLEIYFRKPEKSPVAAITTHIAAKTTGVAAIYFLNYYVVSNLSVPRPDKYHNSISQKSLITHQTLLKTTPRKAFVLKFYLIWRGPPLVWLPVWSKAIITKDLHNTLAASKVFSPPHYFITSSYFEIFLLADLDQRSQKDDSNNSRNETMLRPKI